MEKRKNELVAKDRTWPEEWGREGGRERGREGRGKGGRKGFTNRTCSHEFPGKVAMVDLPNE